LINPEYAEEGAMIGGVLPGAVQAGGVAGNAISSGLKTGSRKLMQSALKPTIEQLRTGKAAQAVDTLLDEGLNATQGGTDAIRGRVDQLNTEIADRIGASSATVSKQKVLDALRGTKEHFFTQVNPNADMAAIANTADEFAAHPLLQGDNIPVQLAQKMKQGTYQVLKKKYGQVGTASEEAQKMLARGLKEGIAENVPGVAALNARESKLLDALTVVERRVLMDANKNPMGLAILANNPATWAAFMADKSALFKSLAARMVNQASKATGAASGSKMLTNAAENYGRLAAPASVATANP
jgi:hypothetical protein